MAENDAEALRRWTAGLQVCDDLTTAQGCNSDPNDTAELRDFEVEPVVTEPVSSAEHHVFCRSSHLRTPQSFSEILMNEAYAIRNPDAYRWGTNFGNNGMRM
ncbi:hypothetical protein V5O48_004738 [Marasmius crinis-equi]|uniref:PH domain-containing protein n=1 Tax=Marasmius crinis-equi TaxID=585013 RepID=A0ABR3FP72_9AGAR